MIQSVVVHTILQTQAALGAAGDADTWPATSQTLTLTLHDVLQPVLVRSIFEALTTSVERQERIMVVSHLEFRAATTSFSWVTVAC